MSNRQQRRGRKQDKRTDKALEAMSAYLDSVTEETYSTHDAWVAIKTAVKGESWVKNRLSKCPCCHHGDGTPRINGEAWQEVNPRGAK